MTFYVKLKKDSFFKPYYDILPKDVTNFPVFWTDKEIGYLKGSSLPGEIRQRREKIRNDYNIIGGLIPGFFDNFTFEKFLWCRTIVGSRNFTITIDGSKRTSMVRKYSTLIFKSFVKKKSLDQGKIINFRA